MNIVITPLDHEVYWVIGDTQVLMFIDDDLLKIISNLLFPDIRMIVRPHVAPVENFRT